MADVFFILKNKFPATKEEEITQNVIIPAEDIQNVATFLKEDLGFDYLMSLSAVDYKDKFALVYHLYSFKTTGKITLKVFLDKEQPSIKSVSKIWPAANWHEREAYDLMGINIMWHPDLRRILLPDDWIGHPLRKDYTRAGFIKMPEV